jgi:hypothetical protein
MYRASYTASRRGSLVRRAGSRWCSFESPALHAAKYVPHDRSDITAFFAGSSRVLEDT